MKIIRLLFLLCISFKLTAQSEYKIKVLNFQADNGFQHDSKQAGLEMIEHLGQVNNWEVITTNDTTAITGSNLETFDVIVFNNNCGNAGRIFSNKQYKAIQNYIHSGGGFVGIHCAGAISNEAEEFQIWYDKLIGTRLVKHPKVQSAKLIVEDTNHIATNHLPSEWIVTDEWHTFSSNPRKNVNVLISLDESSYEGTPKMGGDHPSTWYQYFEGGRSFFTTLGHTKEMYSNDNYQKLVQGGILWASGIIDKKNKLPVTDGLMVDLDADFGTTLEKGSRVKSWKNNAEQSVVKSFDKQDEGRKNSGSGMPRIVLNVPELNGHNTVVFQRQELINTNEDVFDHLITGSGYTWFSIMTVYEQVAGKPGVNSFFGNLRNTNVDKQGQYEGFWAGVNEKNQVWIGARNGLEKGLWNDNNPQVLNPKSLETGTYYLVMGRMSAGKKTAQIELFINSSLPIAKGAFPVNPNANPSKMAIGQERNATNHPGFESFDGEIARFLIYERPLSDNEFNYVKDYLITVYNIKK